MPLRPPLHRRLLAASVVLTLPLVGAAAADDPSAPPATPPAAAGPAVAPDTPPTGVSGASGVAALASVSGRVRLSDAPPAAVVNQRYELVIEGGLVRTSPPRAVVYLEGDFPSPAEPPRATIVQRKLEFSPLLLPVRVGTRVDFPNRDEVYHNVFSFSPAKRFDLGRYRADEAEVPFQLFDRPGLVTLRCDIHEHMRAAILVLPTPHFVVTEADGSFSLPGLPPGTHTLKAWIDSRTTVSRTLTLNAGEELRVELP